MKINEKFVEELYKLFMENQGVYIGSRQQARLILQLKLKKFIPFTYMDRAFKNFLACNLIIDTKESQLMSKQIGLKHFKAVRQKIYKRNSELNNIADTLKSLYPVFQDFSSVVSEIVTMDDIEKLRELETTKKIKIQDILDRSERFSSLNYSDDLDLLYNIPRKTILKLIDTLEKYDSNEAEKKKLNEKINNNEIMDRWNVLIKRGINLIENTLAIDNKIDLFIETSYPHNESQLGSFTANHINFNKNILVIKNTNFNIEFLISRIYIDPDLPIINMENNGLNIKFIINPIFIENLKVLKKGIYENYKKQERAYI